MRKRKLVSLICAVLSLILLLAAHARADGAEDNATDWYFGGGMSLYVVDVPDYAPVWDVDVSSLAPLTLTNASRIRLAGGPIAAPLAEATLGKELDDQWFVEANLEYAYVENVYYRSNRGSGIAAGTHGTVFFPLDGVSLNTQGSWNNAQMELEFEFQQYGAALVAGKTFSGDDWHIRPFAGLWFQERDTTYRMHSEDVSNVPTYFVDEIETMYKGLLAGVGLTLPMNGWDIELETTHGMAIAHTRYTGGWDTINGTASSYLTLDEYNRAYRGTLKASVSIPVEVDWDFNFTSELRYLSYVPRLISSGQAANANLAGPAHLVGESSFSGKLGLEIVHSF